MILIIIWPLAIFAQFESYLSKDFKNLEFTKNSQNFSKQANVDQFKFENEEVEKIFTLQNINHASSVQKIIGTKVFHKNQDQGIYELINMDNGFLSSITKCHSRTKEKIQENENNTFLANFFNSLDDIFQSSFSYNCLTVNKSICQTLRKSNYETEELQTLIDHSEYITQGNTRHMNSLGISRQILNYKYPRIINSNDLFFLKRTPSSKKAAHNKISQYKISEMKRICERTNYTSFKPDSNRYFQIETSNAKDY